MQLIRKAALPQPVELPKEFRSAAAQALAVPLREPRPPNFPLLFNTDMQLVEVAASFFHEHSVQRACTSDTLRTYAEIVYDWFETLEQNSIDWADADAVDLVSYRNRMMLEPSAHTRRPYRISTINHRVRGVLRFYQWAVRTGWLAASPLAVPQDSFTLVRRPFETTSRGLHKTDNSLFVLRQFEPLPRPLDSSQVRELLARLVPPYDLMARWQLYTGLRVSELLRLTADDSVGGRSPNESHRTIQVLRKGRKPGYVIASASLVDETAKYAGTYRRAWLSRAQRRAMPSNRAELFINVRGSPVSKSAYQRAISHACKASGFTGTTHLLRATFACMLLARLERLASEGSAVNPLLVVKILMGHERIETTDRYLRAIAIDSFSLGDVLQKLAFELA